LKNEPQAVATLLNEAADLVTQMFMEPGDKRG
jgi:hypothetical protein